VRPCGLAIILHAHLPFVRHPDQPSFLEERWLFEAVVECYLPLLEVMEGWRRDQLPVRLTLSLSPTLCAMLRDPLLQQRCHAHLKDLVGLAGKELWRTHLDGPRQQVARFYHQRFPRLLQRYDACAGDLVGAFAQLQQAGLLEIITCAATHAVLPLLWPHPASVRAQIRVACDQHRAFFGGDPAGFWLPECAYTPGLEDLLGEANLRWFVVDTHGLLEARPRPPYGIFAPIVTPAGLAVFGRDPASAQQVWSRDQGYPGESAYRDFYRDIGFDLDLPYLRPHLSGAQTRSFTGIKYHRVTGRGTEKEIYDRDQALRVVAEHARHFVHARIQQAAPLGVVMEQPPILVAPYDAELFGHWWYEGPEFLDHLVRYACTCSSLLTLLTPTDYLRQFPTHAQARPNASTWGEGGQLKVWLNEKTAWLYPPLRTAQDRMTALTTSPAARTSLGERALRQAACELLLAQASDWPFILSTGTSPAYARARLAAHLAHFQTLSTQIFAGQIDPLTLAAIETQDNLFSHLDWRCWK
jgi:1,4-alpha-glucan branching enzyme